MWNRRLEIDGMMPMIHAVRNTNPLFAGRVVPGTRTDLAQLPEIVERGKAMLIILLERIDPILKESAFVAGGKISIADIAGFFMMNAAKMLDVAFVDRFPNVARWHADLAARTSGRA
jgi:glutathione S-transferase